MRAIKWHLTGFIIVTLISTEAAGQEKLSLKYLEKGNKLYNKERYQKAQEFYGKALEADSNNLKANLYYGIGLLESDQKFKALKYIEKAYKEGQNISEQIDLYLGLAYQYTGEYEKALQHFKSAKASFEHYLNDERKVILYHMQECENAVELMKNGAQYHVVNLGPEINSSHGEYAPILDPAQEMMWFSSNKVHKKNKAEYFTDVYAVSQKENLSKSVNLVLDQINTKYDDLILDIRNDGREMLIHSYKNHGDIYLSTFINDEWSIPKSISEHINQPESLEGTACFSADGNSIYFTSNRKGGFGGLDIYYSERQVDETWSKPKNLGATINTKGNEESPSISPGGKILFFSSEGHSGIGGYDVFYSLRKENQKWNKPLNMGLSVNTAEDDLSFIISSDGESAYFSSIRQDSYGAEDIYKISLNTYQPGEGNLLASLYPNQFVEEENFHSDNQQLVVSNTSSVSPTARDDIFRNIYFEIDQKQITGEYKDQLLAVADYLKKNIEVKIQLSGHTDDTGTFEHNLQLSKERANEVYHFLTEQGILGQRIKTEAYSNLIPLASNDDEWEGRELNRRVEINILSEIKSMEHARESLITSSD